MRITPASIWQRWKNDEILGGVIRNTGYLFSSNTITLGLNTLQTLIATFLLGPTFFGILGMVTSFASSVNRLLSFRMGELVIKHAGGQLALGRKDKAAAIIKAAGLVEAGTSLVAFLILVLTASWAATTIIKVPEAAPWIVIFGLSILADIVFETSTAVLQLGNHFKYQAILNLAQSIIVTVLLAVAILFQGTIYFVLIAYLLGKVVQGLGTTILAFRWVKPLLGNNWLHQPFSLIENRRELGHFAFSTNLSGSINMVIRDSEILWVGYFLNPTAAGYYKLALALMNLTAIPISQIISTTFPQISKSTARHDWSTLKRLLRRTSAIAAVWIAFCVVGMVLIGPIFFYNYKGGAFLPTLPGMFILLPGFAAQGIFFWNRPLLLSLGKPNFPLTVNAVLGAVKIGLMFLLVPTYGYLVQAGLLSGYFLFAAVIIVWEGLKEIRRQQSLFPQVMEA
jgi:O-antigen/teichoic acid export membrane protein